MPRTQLKTDGGTRAEALNRPALKSGLPNDLDRPGLSTVKLHYSGNWLRVARMGG